VEKVPLMWEMKPGMPYNTSIGKPQDRTPLWKRTRRWKDNIKIGYIYIYIYIYNAKMWTVQGSKADICEHGN
jgi:hypothetical protein